MTGAYKFERALDCTDYTPDDAIAMAATGTPFELADKIAALSGHTYLRDVDAIDWLFNVYGPCVNHSDRPGVTSDHQGRATCAGCSSGAAALGYEDGATA